MPVEPPNRLKDVDPEVEYIKINEIIYRYVYDRDNEVCQICGHHGEEIHHLTYKSHGGGNKTNNLLLLCIKHHKQGYHGSGIQMPDIESILEGIKMRDKRYRSRMV